MIFRFTLPKTNSSPLRINGWNMIHFLVGIFWLMVSTHLKNINQIGNLPQVGMKIKKYLKQPPSFSIFRRFGSCFFFFAWPIFSLQTKRCYGMFIETNVILLMEEIRLTTQHVGNPENNEIFTISTGEFTVMSLAVHCGCNVMSFQNLLKRI